MARYVVSTETFQKHLAVIFKEDFLAVDTETTGLNSYRGAKVFSVIVSTKTDDYYFNFNDQPDHLGVLPKKEYILPKSWLATLCELFEVPNITVYMQNAKFDMHMLRENVCAWNARIVCTEAVSRLVNNLLPSYSLANLGKLIGFEKDSTVEDYITKHKVFTLVDVGKKKPRKDKHYNLVPFEIISEYGMTDGRVTFELGSYCEARIAEMSEEQTALNLAPLNDVFENEIKLTKTLFKMEQRGTRLDIDYCNKAYQYEKEKYEEAAEKFYMYTNEPFEDSATCFKKVFEKLGLKSGVTATGRQSFAEDNLPDNAVTDLILQYRHHYKRATTYFKNYIDMADVEGIIHCNFRQGGTATGRLSSSNPNLQNVPKHGEDDSEFPIRQAFIPREGFFFAMIDYKAMEYRLLMDIINEAEVIRMILEEGLDVHTATANLASVKRLIAKNINFLSIYGGGPSRLMDYTKGTLSQAKQMMKSYFSKLRKVKPFMKAISNRAAVRGFIVNPMGRRLLYHRDRPYVMTNHFIQGGCADIMKLAMNQIDDYLEDKESKMVLTVHDEVIIEVKYGEEHILEELKSIMENSYAYNKLPMEAEIDFSPFDWYNKKAYEN